MFLLFITNSAIAVCSKEQYKVSGQLVKYCFLVNAYPVYNQLSSWDLSFRSFLQAKSSSKSWIRFFKTKKEANPGYCIEMETEKDGLTDKLLYFNIRTKVHIQRATK